MATDHYNLGHVRLEMTVILQVFRSCCEPVSPECEGDILVSIAVIVSYQWRL